MDGMKRQNHSCTWLAFLRQRLVSTTIHEEGNFVVGPPGPSHLVLTPSCNSVGKHRNSNLKRLKDQGNR